MQAMLKASQLISVLGDMQEDDSYEAVKRALKGEAKKNTIRFIVGAGAGAWIAMMIILMFMAFMVIISLLGVFATQPGHLAGKPSTAAIQEIGPDYPIFVQAQAKYGVSWAILAAIAKTESSFGRSENYLAQKGVSKAGAVGYMQFMPTTWSGGKNPRASNSPSNPAWDDNPDTIARYGGYGTDGDGDGIADPYNPWDAIPAAARLLKANRVDADPEKAVYQYNHDFGYVNEVLAQALIYSTYQVPAMVGLWPLPTEQANITATFGQTSANGIVLWPEGHSGIDIACPIGTPVYAVVPGIIKFAGIAPNSGNRVVIATNEGTAAAYSHLSKINVTTLQQVEQGAIIGYSGNSGRSTGPHLHFELYVDNRPSDPLMWLTPPGCNY